MSNEFKSLDAVISIHAPTRGATMRADRVSKTLLYFNPRSHERSDDLGRLLMSLFLNFNPRSHERSDVKGFHFMLFILCNFNPRSHERSDTNTPPKYLFTTISIHAPTRGATPAPKYRKYYDKISIHAPTRGATGSVCSCDKGIIYFNPRSHERSDRVKLSD